MKELIYERPVYLEEYDNIPLFSSLSLDIQINTVATAIVRNEQGTKTVLSTHILQIAELNGLTVRQVLDILEERINGMKNLWIDRLENACEG